MRAIVILAKAMMRGMASIPILAMLYILFYFLYTGVSAVSIHVWIIIGISLAVATVFTGLTYSVWAFVVPFKHAFHSAKRGIQLPNFKNMTKFAYERLLDKANEYMKLWRTASGRINLFSIILLPTRIFAGISLYVFGVLFLSFFILLSLPVIALSYKRQTGKSSI